jgi:hypothetical protein
MTQEITPEMIAALDTLRSFASRYRHSPHTNGSWATAKAIDILDNANFFTPISDAEDAAEDPETDHDHVFASARPDEVCCGAGGYCTLTYGEHQTETARRHGVEPPAVNWNAAGPHSPGCPPIHHRH